MYSLGSVGQVSLYCNRDDNERSVHTDSMSWVGVETGAPLCQGGDTIAGYVFTPDEAKKCRPISRGSKVCGPVVRGTRGALRRELPSSEPRPRRSRPAMEP